MKTNRLLWDRQIIKRSFIDFFFKVLFCKNNRLTLTYAQFKIVLSGSSSFRFFIHIIWIWFRAIGGRDWCWDLLCDAHIWNGYSGYSDFERFRFSNRLPYLEKKKMKPNKMLNTKELAFLYTVEYNFNQFTKLSYFLCLNKA